MRRWIPVVLAVAALGGLIGWRIARKRAEAAEQTRVRLARAKAAPTVSVAPATVRDIVQTYTGVGSAEAPLNVRISSKVTGRIDSVQVHEGDPVKIGQLLVTIDPTELQSQLNLQEAALAQARYRLAQARITQNPTDIQVTTQIRQQEAAVVSAQADYNQTKQNYEAQMAAAAASVTDFQGRASSAEAAIGSANAAIRSAQANLENARSKYARALDLYKQGFVAAQDVDDARTAVRVQEGNLDVARGQLNSATSLRDSALANVRAAQQQLSIVKTKGLADIASAQARLDQAKASLEYARANRAQTPAYRENLSALRAAVDAAVASVGTARAQLAYTTLSSPIDGFVTGRFMDPGALASPGAPILAVQAMRQIWVSVPVPEEVSRAIHLAQSGSIEFDAVPGRSFVGRVIQINPSADPLSRQFIVRLAIDNPRNELKPGMFARVTLVTRRDRGVVVVPREAVQPGKAGPTVVVVSADGTAQRRPVSLGSSDAAGIAIASGVRAGEQVVTLSSSPVKDGQKVRIGAAGGPGGARGRGGRSDRPQS